MVTLMIFRDVERLSKSLIPGEPGTLIIAWQGLLRISFAVLRSQAFDLLFDSLALASDKGFVLTGFVFSTG